MNLIYIHRELDILAAEAVEAAEMEKRSHAPAPQPSFATVCAISLLRKEQFEQRPSVMDILK